MPPLPTFSDTPLPELVDLSGRSVVVTGGARGLGFAMCRRFAEAGASVVVADIDAVRARDGAARLADLPGNAIGVAFDASRADEHDALAARAASELGGLDVWVNNAGVFPFAELVDVTETLWRRVLALNLDGAAWGCRAAARAMRDTGRGGCIINIASTAGYRAQGAGLAAYTASKHGLVGLTKSAAIELAPHGVRVVGIAPTHIATEGVAEAQPALRERMGVDDPTAAIGAQLPAGRAGEPDDVARVALFCASPLAGFVTGATLPVDGGQLAL